MSAPVDVLAVMEAAAVALNYPIGMRSSELVDRRDALRSARAAVARLIEAAQRAEVSFNTVRGCYERNPGNFMAAMRELEQDILPLRAALASIGSAK